MTDKSDSDLQQMFDARYSDAPELNGTETTNNLLHSMASRGSCRDFSDTPVPDNMLNVLCATALASPTKSDLQQRDIILLKSPEVRQTLASLISGQTWVADAPMILIFCGNNRRQRLLHEWHDMPFANDHLDAMFNAATDAAIALGAFVTAAEALGLGCCPISAVRNEAPAVSKLLGLPEHVFPFAGLVIGFPNQTPAIAMRLPLAVTCHVDQYQENDLQGHVQTYDDARAKAQPYAKQRFVEDFGSKTDYAWSDDKVRQYSKSERAKFGEYIRAQGFCLD